MDRVNSLVSAEKKDGPLRLCLDPSDLNKNIDREHFEISVFEQNIVSKVGGEPIFTTFDQEDSYWQITPDEERSLLTTFRDSFWANIFYE